jgi:hypothetical protein
MTDYEIRLRQERNCGHRKAGKLYLVGQGLAMTCDRLPLVIHECPVCGETIRFTRGIQKIDFRRLYGEHESCREKTDWFCPACAPRRYYNTFLMWVGRDYTMDSFISEALLQGVSKRIAQVPSELRIGKDWVFLARKSVNAKDLKLRLNGRKRTVDVIFYAFRPTAIEYILREKELDNKDLIERLKEQGITPVYEVDKIDKQ